MAGLGFIQAVPLCHVSSPLVKEGFTIASTRCSTKCVSITQSTVPASAAPDLLKHPNLTWSVLIGGSNTERSDLIFLLLINYILRHPIISGLILTYSIKSKGCRCMLWFININIDLFSVDFLTTSLKKLYLSTFSLLYVRYQKVWPQRKAEIVHRLEKCNQWICNFDN